MGGRSQEWEDVEVEERKGELIQRSKESEADAGCLGWPDKVACCF